MRATFYNLALCALLECFIRSAASEYSLGPSLISGGSAVLSGSGFILAGAVGQPITALRASGSGFFVSTGFSFILQELAAESGAVSFQRPLGAQFQVRLAEILAQAGVDSVAQPLGTFPAESQHGGLVFLDGAWLIYLPPAPEPLEDSFSLAVRIGNSERIVRVRLRAQTGATGLLDNILSAGLLPGGEKIIRFTGVPGRLYSVQWTRSLSTAWRELKQDRTGPNGVLEFIHSTGFDPHLNFYRLVPAPD